LFWGSKFEDAPKTKERRQKQTELLLDAFERRTDSFHFRVPFNENDGYVDVCESAYVVALGRHGNMETNQITKVWQDIKKRIREGTLDSTILSSAKSSRSMQDYKKRHALGYINFITNLFKNDDVEAKIQSEQTLGDTSPLHGMENVIILPYDNIPQFYREYVVHCTSRGISPSYIAGLSTFRTAFSEVKDIRFLGSKGSFNTCEICNNLSSLLKNTRKKFSKDQLRIVQEFKRLHINQQASERKFLEVRKHRCLELDDKRQPIEALLYPDGMTEMKGETPKLGSTRHTQVGDTISNRIIGVEVYCGPVNTVFIYNTDQLVKKGGNIMIEVMRQGLYFVII
jgi:hypothetical protein